MPEKMTRGRGGLGAFVEVVEEDAAMDIGGLELDEASVVGVVEQCRSCERARCDSKATASRCAAARRREQVIVVIPLCPQGHINVG